jgi:hypothetical protein
VKIFVESHGQSLEIEVKEAVQKGKVVGYLYCARGIDGTEFVGKIKESPAVPEQLAALVLSAVAEQKMSDEPGAALDVIASQQRKRAERF